MKFTYVIVKPINFTKPYLKQTLQVIVAKVMRLKAVNGDQIRSPEIAEIAVSSIPRVMQRVLSCNNWGYARCYWLHIFSSYYDYNLRNYIYGVIMFERNKCIIKEPEIKSITRMRSERLMEKARQRSRETRSTQRRKKTEI